MIPGQNSMGAKATQVVMVETTTGATTSAVAFDAAVSASAPSSRWR